MMSPALLSAALLLLLLLPGGPVAGFGQARITVLVTNSVTNSPNHTYGTYVYYRGILLGGLRRLQDSDSNFTFTYKEDPNYGPFLQSVNGLAGSNEERTYWELLVNTTNNEIIRPDVGIGCYIPNDNDQIILNYKGY
uniref:Transcobalamin-like C-terminal domain-containing protein n=1 Tax=Sparus aurata TaxID=8175 RepID=A0A671V0L7_SPAAU